jgi:hypothetical protein
MLILGHANCVHFLTPSGTFAVIMNLGKKIA